MAIVILPKGRRAISCGASPEALKDELTRCGDLGDVAAARLEETVPAAAELTLDEVRASLLELEAQQGKGATGRKTEQLAAMLQRASPLEARYLLRSIRGKDRTGLGERSLRAALAQVGRTPHRTACPVWSSQPTEMG